MTITTPSTSDVETFVSYFQRKITSIGSIHIDDDPDATPIFQRILYLGIVDTLAKTVYPQAGNRDRFVRFVKKFSNWRYTDKISLPHLARLVSKNPEPELSNLRQFAYTEQSKWTEGMFVTLDKDIDEVEVKKRWPKELPMSNSSTPCNKCSCSTRIVTF